MYNKNGGRNRRSSNFSNNGGKTSSKKDKIISDGGINFQVILQKFSSWCDAIMMGSSCTDQVQDISLK